jgi:hypothetical protein
VSKASAAENHYFDSLCVHMTADWVPCPIYRDLRAVERSHPRGVAMWETGGALKAHHWFAVMLSKEAHLEYDADHDGFERRHGVAHAKLVRDQWRALRITPGPWMTVGMNPKRESWFNRVLGRVQAEGMSDYERAHLG